MATQCTLYITNLTNENLVTKAGPEPYQMDYWSFPNIGKLTTASIDVQFYEGNSDEDDGAEQYYAFNSTSNATVIDVYATSDNKSVHYLSVRSMGGTAPAYCVVAICGTNTIPEATENALSWHAVTGVTTAAPQSHTAPPYEIGPITQDGMAMAFAMVDLDFIFGAQAPGYFNAIKNGTLTQAQRNTLFVALKSAMVFGGKTSYWMTATWNVLDQLPLSSVCMPGTHDSGMGQITASTDGSNACNTQTQTGTILDQLNKGARYFDLRPCLWSGLSGFYLCHYSNEPLVGVFGSAGQPLASALQDVVTFFEQTPGAHELVILKFSHFGELAPTVGVWGYEPMSDDTFADLVAQVQDALGSYLLTASSANVNLNQQKMENLSGHGNRAVAVFDLGQQNEGDFPYSMVNTTTGIFGYRDYMTNPPTDVTPNMVVYDSYAKSDDVQTMINDQKSKFVNYTPNIKQSFLLSWTLTLDFGDLVEGSPCISDLAAEANPLLTTHIDQWIKAGIITTTTTKKPNVLLIDFIGPDRDFAAVTAMQVNAYQ